MLIRHRLLTLLAVLSIVAIPAVLLHLTCAGHSCDSRDTEAGAQAPFCSLPMELRRMVVAGFREGRSPDVLGATVDANTVSTVEDGVPVPWRGGASGDAATSADVRVPVVFFGDGVRHGLLPDRIALDAIAPTLERIAGLRRTHPAGPNGSSDRRCQRRNGVATRRADRVERAGHP